MAAIDFDNKFIMNAVLDFNTPVPKRALIDTVTKSKKKKKIENEESKY